jgi:hypothetical protein
LRWTYPSVALDVLREVCERDQDLIAAVAVIEYAVQEVGGEQMVITAEEYAGLEQLCKKMDATRAAIAV